MKSKIITHSSEWSIPLLERFNTEIAHIADSFGLDYYSNQLEIISAEQMIDAYASVGLPISYFHWSYGKQFENTRALYESGRMGLAYEMVINSSPCIAYLMEENTMAMQVLVIAHACYGHNSFFKGNYMFREWTDAGAIVDYMVFAKDYILQCEAKHGVEEVEQLLDSCHALMSHGVNRYVRPPAPSKEDEELRQKDREVALQNQVNLLWATIPGSNETEDPGQDPVKFPTEPEENLLYFIEKNSPTLKPWQREVVRIVRKIAQYFYPQKQTKVMNEGWACFWHYTIFTELHIQGLISDSFMLEFFDIHSRVLRQTDFDHPGYSGINPYTLGYAMMTDIRRICEAPTNEDKQWFPDFAGSNWQQTMDFAMRNFKDESFVLQYLSPKVIRDLKLFTVVDNENLDYVHVSAIHDEQGYQQIREDLALEYNLSHTEPNVQVTDVALQGDRSLTLQHTQVDGRPMSDKTIDMLKHLRRLWGFKVVLQTTSLDGEVSKTYGSIEPESNHP
jgi:stage V sporulation protein R